MTDSLSPQQVAQVLRESAKCYRSALEHNASNYAVIAEKRAAELERPAPSGTILGYCPACFAREGTGHAPMRGTGGMCPLAVGLVDRHGDGGGEASVATTNSDRESSLPPAPPPSAAGESEPSPQPSVNKAVREWREAVCNLNPVPSPAFVHRGENLCLEIERLEKLVAGSGETRVVSTALLKRISANLWENVGDGERAQLTRAVDKIISGERAGS